MNLVPSRETSALARRAVRAAGRGSGVDAALKYLPQVPTEQRAAFVAELLDLAANSAHQLQVEQARIRGELRRERMAREDAEYTDDDCRRAHALYSGGTRTTWVVVGERVYQRRWQRARRAARRARQEAAA